jgi:hypothetical protein
MCTLARTNPEGIAFAELIRKNKTAPAPPAERAPSFLDAPVFYEGRQERDLHHLQGLPD